MKKVFVTIERRWNGIIRWFESQINNRILEGINSLIQAVKRKARGYRTVEKLIAMINLIAGKIDLQPILGKATHMKQRGAKLYVNILRTIRYKD